MKQIPELSYLLSEVEKEYGRTVATSGDFEALSLIIEMETGDRISSSTLKRLYGYVTLHPTPRIATLDTLARYIHHANFKEYCYYLKKTKTYASTFFTSICLDASDLKKGEKIEVGWAPNRLIRLQYIGNSSFKVISATNSQLMVDDEFQLTSFVLGYPIIISKILRNGKYTQPYIGGRQGGINHLEIIEKLDR